MQLTEICLKRIQNKILKMMSNHTLYNLLISKQMYLISLLVYLLKIKTKKTTRDYQLEDFNEFIVVTHPIFKTKYTTP